MGFLVILPFGALAAWSIAKIYYWLRRANWGPEWWNAFRILSFAGLALGVWFNFFLEYKVTNKRMAGFPIPLAISTLDNGTWTKQILPDAVRYPGIITNFLSGIALCLIPIAVAAFFKENRGKLDPSDKPRV